MKEKLSIKNGWLDGAKKHESPHFNLRPQGLPVSLLVVHNISLPPGEFGGGHIERFFMGNLDVSVHPYFNEIKDLQVSAHCFISRKGDIAQFVSFDDRAWHAGRSNFKGEQECNDFSIGVELEGTDTVAYTPEQYDSLAQLTLALQKIYADITCDRITGHCDIAPLRKTDPGPSFDWHYFFNMLKTAEPR